MKTSEYEYVLPPDHIAQHPAEPRDAARMMVVCRGTSKRIHAHVSELPSFLKAGDLLVVNNTRVIPARMIGRKERTGGWAEVFFIEPASTPEEWEVLIQARRRPRPGSRILLGSGRAVALVLTEGERGRARVRMEAPLPVLDLLEEEGMTPLPPYIRRTSGQGGPAEGRDRCSYQTIYATNPGAVAAPTAGLHFTSALFKALAERYVERAEVTLHVGPGTFRPVQTENLADHPMEAERYEISEACAEQVAAARRRGGRVIAVGSTSVRALETAADRAGGVRPGAGRTNLFIHPPYPFRVVDGMLTNFHLPRSTLLAMVCALGGRETVLEAYSDAVASGYRFYSYGDAMLLL